MPVRLCLAFLATGLLSLPAATPDTPASSLAQTWMPDPTGLKKHLADAVASPAFSPESFPANAAENHRLLQWRLIDVIGWENIQAVAAKDGEAFLKWLFTTPAALETFCLAGPPDAERSSRTLEIWRDIFNADPESKDGLWLRVAAATALVHSRPVKAMADGSVIDPLARYRHFKAAHAAKKLFPYFSEAPAWELRYVVNSWAIDSDLDWAIGTVTDPKLKSQEKIGNAAYMVPYRDKNSKGVSVQNGREYYDHKPVTLSLMVEVGGVCGAISRFGTSVAQAHGIPAMPFGQPGHCAFTWKTDASTWKIGNNISGWAGSSQHDGIKVPWGARGSYLLLAQAARQDAGKFARAEKISWLAALSPNPAPMLEKALANQPLHCGAWQQLVAARLADGATKKEDLLRLSAALMKALPAHPLPLLDLLAPLEPKLGLEDPAVAGHYVSHFCAALASVPAGGDHGTAHRAQSELIKRVAMASAPRLGRQVDAFLNDTHEDDGEAAKLPGEQRQRIQSLLETALSAAAARPDLQEALTARYLALQPDDPAVAAQAIRFFGNLFEQARQNGDRKPAIALARRLIILSGRAEDAAAQRKYTDACQKLLKK